MCLNNIGFVDGFEYGYMDRVSVLEIGYIYDVAFPLKLAWNRCCCAWNDAGYRTLTFMIAGLRRMKKKGVYKNTTNIEYFLVIQIVLYIFASECRKRHRTN